MVLKIFPEKTLLYRKFPRARTHVCARGFLFFEKIFPQNYPTEKFLAHTCARERFFKIFSRKLTIPKNSSRTRAREGIFNRENLPYRNFPRARTHASRVREEFSMFFENIFRKNTTIPKISSRTHACARARGFPENLPYQKFLARTRARGIFNRENLPYRKFLAHARMRTRTRERSRTKT